MKEFFARLLARLRVGAAPEVRAVMPAPMMAESAMPMLDCESVMRQLWDYLDGELTPQRAAAIRAHLDVCQRCYPQYEFERSFLDAVAGSARQHSNLERLRSQLTLALEAKGLAKA